MSTDIALAHYVISRAITHLSKDCPQDNDALKAISILLAARKTVLQ